METKPTIYLSHPIETFATPESLMVLKELQRTYPNYKIIDPEDLEIPIWKPCKDCMQKTMKKVVFPLIDKCNIFAVWAPVATCRIECELHHAWEEDKEVINISNQFEEVEIEDMTLQEYHIMEVEMEVM